MKPLKRRSGKRICHKDLLQRLTAELAAAKRQCRSLLSQQNQSIVLEQVLLDTILQLEDVISFKTRIESGLPPRSTACSSGRYVTRLLGELTPETVAQVSQWSAQEWVRAFAEGHTQLPLLLDVLEREDDLRPGDLTVHAAAAEQRLNQAVDRVVSLGVLGCVFQETVGATLGICTATNHLTQQIEAPPEQHWQRAADRMQLTHVQLQQLAAGYGIFVQHQKIQKETQLAVAQLFSSPNSCGVQLLAAAKEASSTIQPSSNSTWEMAARWRPPAADHAAGAAAAAAASGRTDSQPDLTGTHMSLPAAAEDGTCNAAGADPPLLSRDMPAPEAAAAAAGLASRVASKLSVAGQGAGITSGAAAAAAAVMAADAAADAEPAEEEEEPLVKVNQLMALLNRSCLAIHLLLFNTLTRRQVARMVVACYPFLPRAAPLIEAATASLAPQDWLEERSAEAVAAAAAAAASSRDEQMSWQSSQQRAAFLSKSLSEWWQDAP